MKPMKPMNAKKWLDRSTDILDDLNNLTECVKNLQHLVRLGMAGKLSKYTHGPTWEILCGYLDLGNLPCPNSDDFTWNP